MAKRHLQSAHENMIGYAVAFLIDNGYKDIRADIPGYPVPVKITRAGTDEGQVPDITGESDRFTLFEVETTDSINDEHTIEQWSLFAHYAGSMNAAFCVVVPKGSATLAVRRLEVLSITARVWEI